MNCRLALPLLNSYVDGELTAADLQRVNDHLAECPACAQQASDLQTLQAALASEAIYHHAPGSLRGRLVQTLAAGKTASVLTQPLTLKSTAAILLGIALLVAVSWAGWWWLNQPAPSLMELSLKGHDRAFSRNRQTELTSSDPQVVKHWLQEKTGQAVVVKDLSAHKFTLVGSRVESSTIGPISVLVYAAGDKTISLYHWPSQCPQHSPHCDTNLPHYQFSTWCDAKVIYWAISEIPSEQLLEFTKNMKGNGALAK